MHLLLKGCHKVCATGPLCHFTRAVTNKYFSSKINYPSQRATSQFITRSPLKSGASWVIFFFVLACVRHNKRWFSFSQQKGLWNRARLFQKAHVHIICSNGTHMTSLEAGLRRVRVQLHTFSMCVWKTHFSNGPYFSFTDNIWSVISSFGSVSCISPAAADNQWHLLVKISLQPPLLWWGITLLLTITSFITSMF